MYADNEEYDRIEHMLRLIGSKKGTHEMCWLLSCSGSNGFQLVNKFMITCRAILTKITRFGLEIGLVYIGHHVTPDFGTCCIGEQ